MNKYSKLVVLLVVVGLVAFMGNQVTVPYRPGVTPSVIVKTFANSQVDTVLWVREGGVSAIAFAAEWKDSVTLSSAPAVMVRRKVNNIYLAPLGGDTLTNFTSFTNTANVAAPDSCTTNAVTLAPLADAYQFIVKYNSSGNGTGTPTVVYEVIKQYSSK